MPTPLPDNIGEFSATRANELFESHKKFLEWRKTEWATRGPAALEQRMAARATKTTWRQMKGMDLVRHEIGTPGTRPFAIGLGYVLNFLSYHSVWLGTTYYGWLRMCGC